jgi:hypothetical protein
MRMRARKMEEELRTCTTKNPVLWYASAAHLSLRDLLTRSKEGSEPASMRRGTYYAKIGGAGGVHEGYVIHKGRCQ